MDAMLAEARRRPDQECCGLLAGRDGVITAVLPAENALASSTAFEIAPADLFRLFREMRAAGLEHLGIYHSHLAGPSVPSPTDIAEAAYPDSIYVVISLQTTPPSVRAFTIVDALVSEVPILISSTGEVESPNEVAS